MKKIMSFEEINNIAKKLAEIVEPNSLIALIGDLGTGKTAFVKSFAEAFGVTENIKSPTFNYYLEYRSGRLPLYHFDVYRLCEPQEIYEIGYEDCLDSGGVVLVEWANIITSELPKEYIEINLYYYDDDKREVEIHYKGDANKEEVLLKNVGFSN